MRCEPLAYRTKQGMKIALTMIWKSKPSRIAEGLQLEGLDTSSDAEIVALIAYLQRLGKDIKLEKVATNQ
jgi:cbb3-type cytochrome oxidase cytochrome c subunit